MPSVSTSSGAAATTPRTIEVAAARLEQWIVGFGERHGGVVAIDPTRLQAADGSVAELERFDHDPLGVILVRRGGYAVGRVRGGRLVARKVGTRYVQSRTAAGGWSQQRYARRRTNQAEELIEAVADHATRILIDLTSSNDETGEIPILTRPPRTPGLVVGGDRQLVDAVLADRRLRAVRELPRRSLFDLPDPNRAVLERAVQRASAVRITLAEVNTL